MKIISNEENVRIDKYLSDNTDYSREKVQKLISKGLVTVNEKVIKASYKVLVNDVIEVLEDDIDNDTNIVPVKMSLDIVYEDDYLMIINKPSEIGRASCRERVSASV